MKPALTQEQPDKPCVAHQKNLNTIVRAARNGDLGLVEVQLAATGERLAALTAFSKDGDEIVMTPLAVLFNGNPYEMLNPPNPDGGFHSQEEVRGEEAPKAEGGGGEVVRLSEAFRAAPPFPWVSKEVYDNEGNITNINVGSASGDRSAFTILMSQVAEDPEEENARLKILEKQIKTAALLRHCAQHLPDILEALDWITKCATMAGPVGTTPVLISREHMDKCRQLVLAAKEVEELPFYQIK